MSQITGFPHMVQSLVLLIMTAFLYLLTKTTNIKNQIQKLEFLYEEIFLTVRNTCVILILCSSYYYKLMVFFNY